MRTLSSTLITAQKDPSRLPYVRLTFSLSGESDVVIEQDRILTVPSQEETDDSHTATIVFNNADGYFTSLDFKGWQMVMEWGLKTTSTVEYSALPPMKVLGQNLLSSQGIMRCTMTFIGIPDLLAKDKASGDYLHHWSDTKTVKTLIGEILTKGGTLTNLTGTATGSPITLVAGTNTVVVTADGTFTIVLPAGSTGRAISGTATVTSSPVALVGGSQTITVTGGGAGKTITIMAVDTELTESQETSDGYLKLDNTRDGVGQLISIASRTVTKISFRLKKNGSPAGTNVIFRIESVTSGVLASVNFPIASIGTDPAWCEGTLATSLLVNESINEDHTTGIWLFCLNTAGTATDYVSVSYNTTDLKNHENLISIPTGDTPDDSMAEDCAYKYKYTATGISVFSHCEPYDVDFDSEDSLIDVYYPAAGFKIFEGSSRLDAVNELLRYTGCVKRVESDGDVHVFVPMTAATKHIYLTDTTDADSGLYANNWAAQTFTTSARHHLTSVKLLVYSTGAFGGVTVNIYSTTAGKPSGDVLATGTILAASIPDATGWPAITLTECTLGAGCFLAASTMYAIEVRKTTYDATESGAVQITWGRVAAGGLANGTRCTTSDAGVNWTIASADMVFEEWSADDYNYSLVDGDHTFFSKAVRKALVVPNKITVHSFPDDDTIYTGNYTDSESYAIVPIEDFVRAKLTSSAQGTAIATAMIGQAQMASQRGSATVPMNLGAEIWDYVTVTDSRQSDTRTGNIGYIKRWYLPGQDFHMSFSFSKLTLRGVGVEAPLLPRSQWDAVSYLESRDEAIADKVMGVDKDVTKLEDWRKGLEDVTTATQIGIALIGYLKRLVEDLTPQLGGDLVLNGHNIDFPTTPNISDCLDEDTMVSDSATKLATQQSIKAYVDAGNTRVFQAQANDFRFPSPLLEWRPTIDGAYLPENLSAKKLWIPLNFLLTGDILINIAILGDATEAVALTLDARLYRTNHDDPLTTTELSVFTQVTADGNFTMLKTALAITIATDKQYAIEILGTTGAGDSIVIMGVEVSLYRVT